VFAGVASLPKFQPLPQRILIFAHAELAVFTDAGQREFDSTSTGPQVARITHAITAEATMAYGPLTTAAPGPPPPVVAMEVDAAASADSGFVNVPANDDGDTGPPFFFPLAIFNGSADEIHLPIAASVRDANSDKSVTALYGEANLANFIASPGSQVLGIGHSGTASGEQSGTGQTQFNPQPLYNVTASVTYEYVYIPSDLEPTYRHGPIVPYVPAQPRHFQPMFTGTGAPGGMLYLELYDAHNDLLGSTTVPVDAGGNWMANLPGTSVGLEPHHVVLRQTYAGYNALAEAGYNLRLYYQPAVMGGIYVSQYLTVDNVLGRQSVDVSVDALYQSSLHPLLMGWQRYGFELLPVTAAQKGS